MTGNELLQLRRDAKVRTTELAKRLNVTTACIWRWECKGNKKLTFTAATEANIRSQIEYLSHNQPAKRGRVSTKNVLECECLKCHKVKPATYEYFHIEEGGLVDPYACRLCVDTAIAAMMGTPPKENLQEDWWKKLAAQVTQPAARSEAA